MRENKKISKYTEEEKKKKKECKRSRVRLGEVVTTVNGHAPPDCRVSRYLVALVCHEHKFMVAVFGFGIYE